MDATTRELRIVPVHEAPWADLAAVFGTRGDAAHCWCQWWKLTNSEYSSLGDEARCERLRADASARATSPGLLAYRGDEPVGWCGVEPRPRYGRIGRSRAIARALPGADFDDGSVWSVVCFVVPRANRGQGLTSALLTGAIDLARDGGARLVEAYPVDVRSTGRVSSAQLFPGALSTFESAGFEIVAYRQPERPVVQLRL